MPRIRTLQPDIWNDEDFGMLSIEAQDLFIGLITQADDEGRLKGSPDRLRALIWPYKPEIDAARVDQWLEEIAARDLIVRYEAGGKPHVFLPGWEKNQRIHRPAASKLPAPVGADPSGAPSSEADPSGASAADPSGAANSSQLSANSRDELRTVPLDKEGKRKGGTPSPSTLGDETADSGTARAENGGASRAATATRLFAYWRQQLGKDRAKFTLDRRRKVEARLREGYTETDIRLAIDGATRAAFVNDEGKRFDDLELICRSGSKLEDFMQRPARNNGRRGRPDTPNPTSAAVVEAVNRGRT